MQTRTQRPAREVRYTRGEGVSNRCHGDASDRCRAGPVACRPDAKPASCRMTAPHGASADAANAH